MHGLDIIIVKNARAAGREYREALRAEGSSSERAAMILENAPSLSSPLWEAFSDAALKA